MFVTVVDSKKTFRNRIAGKMTALDPFDILNRATQNLMVAHKRDALRTIAWELLRTEQLGLAVPHWDMLPTLMSELLSIGGHGLRIEFGGTVSQETLVVLIADLLSEGNGQLKQTIQMLGLSPVEESTPVSIGTSVLISEFFALVHEEVIQAIAVHQDEAAACIAYRRSLLRKIHV